MYHSFLIHSFTDDHQITTYTKINSRWIKDLNISHDTIKVLEENIGWTISDIPCSHIFTNMSHTARGIKERINICAIIKTWIFYIGKETALIWKQNQPYGNLYLPMIPWTRVWSPKYIKNSHDSTPGRQTTQLKTGQRTGTDTSPRRTCIHDF